MRPRRLGHSARTKVPVGIRTLGLGALLLAGCATYRPLPLPEGSGLAPDARALTVQVEDLRGTGLAGYPFDPRDGLDLTETAMLAVSHNPDLKAARAKSGVARSQLLEAGLLPDPVLSLGVDVPVGGPAAVPGLGVGLTEALAALVTRPARVDAAEARVRSVDLALLWDEWQVVQQARLLFVRVREGEKRLALLDRRRDLYREQCALDRRALPQGEVTLDEAAVRRAALLEIEAARGAGERQAEADRYELRALLGLAPGAPLALQGPADVPAPTDEEVRAALAELPGHRPDLLALRAAYRSQEARLRAAVLGQFPAVDAEIRGARDTDRVRTAGLSVGLRLPFFNRNRGAIAVAEATREQLRLEYQARLARTEGEVHRLWTEHGLARAELRIFEEDLPGLEAVAREADRAYAARDLTGPVHLATVDAYLRSAYGAEERTQGLLEARVALRTVLGPPRALGETAARAAQGPGPSPGARTTP